MVKPSPPTWFAASQSSNGSLVHRCMVSQRDKQPCCVGVPLYVAHAAVVGQSLEVMQSELHKPRAPKSSQRPDKQAHGCGWPLADKHEAPSSPSTSAKQPFCQL